MGNKYYYRDVPADLTNATGIVNPGVEWAGPLKKKSIRAGSGYKQDTPPGFCWHSNSPLLTHQSIQIFKFKIVAFEKYKWTGGGPWSKGHACYMNTGTYASTSNWRTNATARVVTCGRYNSNALTRDALSMVKGNQRVRMDRLGVGRL